MIALIILSVFVVSMTSVHGQDFSSYDQFVQAVTSNFPGATPSEDQWRNFNQMARNAGGINDQQEAAMALAQFQHESWGLRLKRECVPGSPWPCTNFCNNDQPTCRYPDNCGDRPGKLYFGRGYTHLTYSCNYQRASRGIFNDERLLDNPDLVSDDESVAWQTAFYYWRTVVQVAPGVREGQFGAATKAINGPRECGPNADNPNGAATRYNIYKNVRRAWGLPGDGDPSGCN